MVASIFILQGYDTFRRPERVAPLAEPVVRPLVGRVPRWGYCWVFATRAKHRFGNPAGFAQDSEGLYSWQFVVP